MQGNLFPYIELLDVVLRRIPNHDSDESYIKQIMDRSNFPNTILFGEMLKKGFKLPYTIIKDLNEGLCSWKGSLYEHMLQTLLDHPDILYAGDTLYLEYGC